MNLQEYNNSLESWFKSLRDDEKSQNTITQYKRSMATFTEFLQENNIAELDKEAVLNYKESMIKELEANRNKPKTKAKKKGRRPLGSISTINIRLKAVNKFLKDIGEPALTVKPLKDETANVLDDMLTEKEYNRLLEWADKLGKAKIKLIVETLAGTGIRISELEGITVEALKSRVATVTNKGKTRKVFIPKGLAKKLRAYCKENGIKSGIIFCSRDGSKLLDQAFIRKEIKAITGKARGITLSKAHPHIFRHLFAKRYATMPGGNPYVLPMLLGHSDTGQSVTALYVKPTTKELLKIVDEIEAYYTIKPERKTAKKPRKRK